MTNPHVRVFIDDDKTPIIDEPLPTELDLDTRTLADGPHILIVRAEDQNGTEGVEEIPFNVQNGPGIKVSGLRRGTTRRGTVSMKVDAFSSDDPFDSRRAEARSAIPTWVWIVFLCVIAWVIFYVATMWEVPQKYKNTPTFAPEVTQPAPADGTAGSTSTKTLPGKSGSH